MWGAQGKALGGVFGPDFNEWMADEFVHLGDYANRLNWQHQKDPGGHLGVFDMPGERMVVVGDLHSDFDQTMKVLIEAKLVEASSYKWIGETATLVITGDLLDRECGTRRIFELLMKLEKEAKAAGGLVVMTIGNHEEIQLYWNHEYSMLGPRPDDSRSWPVDEGSHSQLNGDGRETFDAKESSLALDFYMQYAPGSPKGKGERPSEPSRAYFEDIVDFEPSQDDWDNQDGGPLAGQNSWTVNGWTERLKCASAVRTFDARSELKDFQAYPDQTAKQDKPFSKAVDMTENYRGVFKWTREKIEVWGGAPTLPSPPSATCC